MAAVMPIDEAPPKIRLFVIPIASVMLASMLPALLPIIASSPILPPFGLLMLLGWRLLRHELWPIWIAVPLGLWDDMFSGQPIGSAMALWTLAVLAIEVADRRLYWRDVKEDWALAAASIAFCLIGGGWLALSPYPIDSIIAVLLPQITLTILLFPMALRCAGWLDNKRLKR